MKVVVVPTNPMPVYVKNYLQSGNTSYILQQHYFNNSQRLLLVTDDAWPYLSNLAQAAGTQSTDVSLNKRILVSQVNRAYLAVGSATLPPSHSTGNVSIDPDILIDLQDASQSLALSWGLDMIDQRVLPLDGNYYGFNASVTAKRTVHLYVLDTGIYPHTDFPSTPSYDFNYYPSDPATDCNGHGTHVTGIAVSKTFGVCPSSKIVIHSVKILNCFGAGDTGSVAAGLLWVLNNKQDPAVINLSVGMSGIDSTLSSLVLELIQAGVAVVGAGGNQFDDSCRYFPAGIGGVVGIGAIDQPFGTGPITAASYSNYGSCIDIWAPGSSILSTMPNNLTGFKSGTSMASPCSAGAVLLKLSTDTTLSALEAASQVVSESTKSIVTNSQSSTHNNLLWVPSSETPLSPTTTTTAATVSSTSVTSINIASTTTTASAATTTAAASTTTTAATTTAASSTTRSTSTTSMAAAVTTANTVLSTTSASSTAAATSNGAVAATTNSAATTTGASTTRASTSAASTSTTASASTTRAAASTTSARATTTTSRASSSSSTGIINNSGAERGPDQRTVVALSIFASVILLLLS